MEVRRATPVGCVDSGSPPAALATGRRRPPARATAWLVIASLGVVTAATSGAAARMAPAPEISGCMAGPATCYGQMATDAAAVQQDLAPEYEVGLGGAVYGPTSGVPVPWAQITAWVAAHPADAAVGTVLASDFRLTDLTVLGGHAYMLFAPDGRLVKLYLSASPLQWD